MTEQFILDHRLIRGLPQVSLRLSRDTCMPVLRFKGRRPVTSTSFTTRRARDPRPDARGPIPSMQIILISLSLIISQGLLRRNFRDFSAVSATVPLSASTCIGPRADTLREKWANSTCGISLRFGRLSRQMAFCRRWWFPALWSRLDGDCN